MKRHMQPHIMCGVGDVGKYVLLPGDPRRVEKISELFEENTKVADYRGFVTHTGNVGDIRVTACSTGIGCPSAAIVVEELSRIGAKTFIRVGTTGSLQTNIGTGDIVIATAAVRADGASRTYMPIEGPAVADFKVTKALLEATRKSKHKVHLGPVVTSDAFYGDIENSRRWSKVNILAVEMECSVIFTLAMLKKLMAGAILAVDGNPILGVGKGEFELGDKTGELDGRVTDAIREEIRIAIQAIKALENESKTQRK